MRLFVNKIHNLSLDSESEKYVKNNYPDWDGGVHLREPLGELVNELCKLNPTYRFIMSRVSRMGNDAVASGTVNVQCDGESLGTLKCEYGRGRYMAIIYSDRISNPNRKAGSSDYKRALSIAKKALIKKSVPERITKAHDDATGTIDSLVSGTRYSIGRLRSQLEGLAFAFAREMRQEFRAYLDIQKKLNVLNELEDHELEMETMDQIKDSFVNRKTALVILDGDQYIVKVGDVIQLCTATTLPEQMRSRLGMLKLVNEKQMVTHAGCRVNDIVFVVVMDNEELT